MANEADTCRRLITPKLQVGTRTRMCSASSGWSRTAGQHYKRKAPKRVDYLLSYWRDTPLAVVKAILDRAFKGEL